MINKFRNLKNDKIGKNIRIAFERCEEKLIRIYIGAVNCGPMLQYDTDGSQKWDGYNYYEDIDVDRYKFVDFASGAWTNCYSRGNCGKNYACGGNWSGHTIGTHPDIAAYCRKPRDEKHEVTIIGNDYLPTPEGITPDITMHEIDCSWAWAIWFPTAKNALECRLSGSQILTSTLPMVTKNHLAKNETPEILSELSEIIDAYNL